MSTGYTSRGNPSNSNQSTGLNGEAPLGRGFVSGSQTPISLWGAPSTSSTFDRGTGSRRAVRGQSSTSVGSTTSPAEQELLREAILSLSGASGTLIQYNPTLDAFVPASNLVISPSIQSHILRISVCGWLYNRVRRFIDGVRDDPAAGKVMLSLALSVDEQLTEYLRLITQLEAQLNFDNDPSNYQDTSAFGSTANTTATAVAPPSGQFTASASAAQSTYSLADTGQGSLGSSRQPLTLLRLSHWLMEPKRRLKILAALADNCASLKGGALVSKVYEMAQNGGPQLKAMLTNILVDVTRTIYEMIALWIYDGRLSSDPNQEFFITTNPSANKDNLWSEKYGLRKSMVPVFISKDQARKILLIGKSVNFLMHVCGDPQHFKDLEAVRKTRITQRK
uniref:Gamma-tubulin complex component n=1 Tax=Mesocestoides corti TaxID=53468 RepID=A0A5K3EZA1_MESCO